MSGSKYVSPANVARAKPMARIGDEDNIAAEMIENIDGHYKGSQMWATQNDSFFPCASTKKKLPAGQYLVNYSDAKGIYFTKKEVNLDALLVLPDSKAERVIASLDNFWSREHKFREYGFLWKRGILLWGPPGSGKTVLTQQLAAQIIDKGGIAVYLTDPAFVAEGLRVLRMIEKTRPIVVMIEDIDAIVQNKSESAMLALLDGELQIDNVVFIATTNYPERMDKRLMNRPSRFDEIIKIGMPSAAARKMFIQAKVPRLNDPGTESELARWVEGTAELSVAHMREVIISVECLGNELERTLKRLRKMNNIQVKSTDADTRKPVGFGPSQDIDEDHDFS